MKTKTILSQRNLLFLLSISIIYYSSAMKKKKSFPKEKYYGTVEKFEAALKGKSEKQKKEIAKKQINLYKKRQTKYKKILKKIEEEESQVNFWKRILVEDSVVSNLDQIQCYKNDDGINTGYDMLDQIRRFIPEKEKEITKLKRKAKHVKPSTSVVQYAYHLQNANKKSCYSSCSGCLSCSKHK